MALACLNDLDAGEHISSEAQYLSNREDYVKFLERLYREEGIDLSLYKQNQMRRRINMSVRQAGFDNYCAFLDSIKNDQVRYRQFIDRITINVTEFLRNSDKYANLENRYLLPLLKQKPGLTLWSAGCSSGEEPYSLALLLEKHNASPMAKVMGWDFDQQILARAKEGIYDAKTLLNVPRDLLNRYFIPLPDGKYEVGPALRKRVRFERHNLLEDRFPTGVDIILCRNVVIYFKEKPKEELNLRFAKALDKNGVFMIGASERVTNAEACGLDSPEPFFYVHKGSQWMQKPAAIRPGLVRPKAS
jgi:chemotaxis protein methyltransferase CheR